ncbi:MAG TPA: arginine--tRNA ligase [Candidatus Nanoarchaeia archaeon]|nr:arginine--tRNA ligase [Candidatus Nanoarchaeia archaeon]
MDLFKQQIAKIISNYLNAKIQEILSLIEVPPDSSLGDYAFPCFVFAKELKKNPNEIAKDLSNKIKPNKFLSKIESKGPYLNFFVNNSYLADLTIKKIMSEKDDYGKGDIKKEKVMIEFSQPNTHKEFHIGHLRNVALGDSLVKIFSFNGYKTISANYIGDIGNHVAKCIWIYLKKYKGKEPKTNKGAWLGRLYTEATKLIEENENFKDEVQAIQKKLEEGDKNLTKIWKDTRDWSLQEFNLIYNLLSVKFEIFFYESEEEKEGKRIVKELLKNKIAELSEGAVIINLEEYNLPIFLLLKKDGTSLYSTKDIALAKTKFTKFKIDKSVYVVADEQKLYFQQLFKTLEIIGFKQAKDCYHLPYALVMLESGKMSSREGNIIKFSDLYNETLNFSINETAKRHKDWDHKKIENISQKICLGALKFSMICQDTNKVIIFNKEKSLSFEGYTAPYIQYSVARATSILKSSNKLNKKPGLLNSIYEQNLIKKLSEFPQIVIKAKDQFKPSIISQYTYELAQQFNEFYHNCQVLKSEEPLRSSRLILVMSTKQVLENALSLLGIESPTEM